MSDQAEETKIEEPTFPIRFIATIMDSGFGALSEYLKENEAPQPIINIAEGLDLLRGYIESKARKMNRVQPDEGTTTGVILITDALDKLEYEFYGPQGTA
jgi:hypothetical protein